MKMKPVIPLALAALIAVLLFAFPTRENPDKPLTIFAASSFAWVLHENEALIEEATGLKIVIVEAASSTLARQIAGGAPADVFITADKAWLNYLAENGHYEGDPVELARNRLVWAADKNHNPNCPEEKPRLPRHFCNDIPTVVTGDPEYVPLGKFTMEFFKEIRLEDVYRKQMVPASSARIALRMLENHAAEIGILYRTDALSSESIKIIAEVPEESHSPIIYWAVAVKQSNRDATKNFLDFLKSEDFKTILQDKGFEVN
jgi:molybdate transport system substrate-binding protein